MSFYNNVYIGHVETINTNANVNEKFTQHKVVALKLIGFDSKKKIPQYKPLKRYGEYYKIVSVERLDGFVSNSKINKALKKTGKEEVKVLKKVA